MTLHDFIHKHATGVSLRDAISELDRRLNASDRHPPVHLPDQRDLIHDLFDGDGEKWLIFLDAGRYDYFERLVGDYFKGGLRRAYNGGEGYTGDWTVRTLRHEFGDRGLWSWVPMGEMQDVDYYPHRHFALSPDIQGDVTVDSKLAALGYKAGDTVDVSASTDAVNKSVRDRPDWLQGGVIRYLKPHPPFDGLEELTSGGDKTIKTRTELRQGDLTHDELANAYERTYRTGFEAARELVPELDGDVVLTTDHGTCLHCGQLFHGRHHDKHDHLTTVPWYEVDGVV